MIPLNHLGKKILQLFKNFLIYLLVLFLIMIVFGRIYDNHYIVSPYAYSLDVLLGIANNQEKVHNIIIAQKIINEVFVVLWLGNFLSKLLSPINPIYFSKYIAYDTVFKKYYFRYWIISRRNNYLYDVNIKIILVKKSEFIRGINKMKTSWKSEHEYNYIRGIRYVMIEDEDAITFNNAIKKASNDDVISIMIKGTTDNGTTYCSNKIYNINDIVNGSRFVSIQSSEYKKMLKEYGVNIKKFSTKNDKEIIRLQHFNKLFKLSKKNKRNTKSDKDILTAEKIIKGQYNPFIQRLVDLYSKILWLLLEK